MTQCNRGKTGMGRKMIGQQCRSFHYIRLSWIATVIRIILWWIIMDGSKCIESSLLIVLQTMCLVHTNPASRSVNHLSPLVQLGASSSLSQTLWDFYTRISTDCFLRISAKLGWLINLQTSCHLQSEMGLDILLQVVTAPTNNQVPVCKHEPRY